MTRQPTTAEHAPPSNSRSSRSRRGPSLDTWPFWAPSHGASVHAALDVADVGPGVHLVDLGCGDGRVLEAAARRGARVTGIEADDSLVDDARARLAAAGLEADVLQGDLLDPDVLVEADVYLAYLAPATLQRLHPLLAPRRGAQLVAIDFDVPGLVPSKRYGDVRRYRLPGRRRRVPWAGWPSAGTVVAAGAEAQSLWCLDLVHPGGDVEVRTSRDLAGAISAVAGADRLDDRAHLAVDLRCEPLEAGTVIAGGVRVSGVEEHGLVLVVTEDDDESGMWDLTADGLEGIRQALRRRHPPTALTDLLAAAG